MSSSFALWVIESFPCTWWKVFTARQRALTRPNPASSPPPSLELVLVEGKMTICRPSCPVTGQQPSTVVQFHCPLSALECVLVCTCLCVVSCLCVWLLLNSERPFVSKFACLPEGEPTIVWSLPAKSNLTRQTLPYRRVGEGSGIHRHQAKPWLWCIKRIGFLSRHCSKQTQTLIQTRVRIKQWSRLSWWNHK